MKRAYMGLIVRAVLAGLLLLAGWQMLDGTDRTDAQRQQDSADIIANYHPVCDGKSMRRGDTCIVFGGGSGDKGGTYQHMIDRYAADNTPEILAAVDRRWRVAGVTTLGLAALTLLFFVLSLVEVIRHGTGQPNEVTIPYQARVCWLCIGAALAVFNVVSITEGQGWPAWLTAALGMAIFSGALAATVSSARTRIGRPRWAKRHGHTYERSDPDLLERLGRSDLRPFAGGVVTGTYRGRAFLIFDYALKDARHTALVIALPDDLPLLEMAPKASTGPRLLGVTAQRWADQAPQVVAAADRHYPWAFIAAGSSIWAKYDEFLSPGSKQLDRRLDGLHHVGTDLAALPTSA